MSCKRINSIITKNSAQEIGLKLKIIFDRWYYLQISDIDDTVKIATA